MSAPTPPAPAFRGPRLDSLTGLRWWAAFAVFLHHMTNLAPLPVRNALDYGNYGVMFFFVLSGFVLTWSASESVSARTFWVRRFARIYPSHFVALLLAIPVFYSFAPDPAQSWVKPVDIGILLLSFLLVQGWWRDPVILFSGNPAAWTLTCEAFFYALHPALNRGLHAMRIGWRPRVKPILIYLAGAGFLAWVLLSPRLGDTGPIGAFLRATTNEWLIILCVLLIITVAARDVAWGRSILRWKPLVKLGDWSYSFYLIHATSIYAVKAVVGVQPNSWWNLVWYAGMLVVSIALAAALHYLVEKPCERFIRSRWASRIARKAVAASSSAAA